MARQNLLMLRSGNNPVRYTVLRVYARAGETVQMGSSAMGLAGGQDNIGVYAPGTGFASSTDSQLQATLPSDPVFATDIFDCNADDPGTGRIASRAEELAGPAPNAGGWAPCEFVAPADGIYPVVMFSYGATLGIGSGTVATPNVATSQNTQISIWDVTVRDAGGAVQPGRLFSNHFSYVQSGAASRFSSYVYSPAGHRYRVQFFDHAGAVWDLAVNDAGVIDANTRLPIFASFDWGNSSYALLHTEAVAPQNTAPDLALDSRYPIFVREPDRVAIEGPGGLAETRSYATEPSLSQQLQFAGSGGEANATAPGAGGTIGIDAPAALAGLDYTLTLDLNSDGSFGNADDVQTSGTLSQSGNAFSWDGRDASGATAGCGTYAYQLRTTAPAMHLVSSGSETSGGTQIERLSLPGDLTLGDPLAASYNDVDPYKGVPITNASPSAVTNDTSGPGFHAWSGGGTAFIDTWAPALPITGSGTFEVRCASAGEQPPITEPPTTTPPTTNPPTTNPPTDGGQRRGSPKREPKLRVSTTVDRPPGARW